MLSVRHYPELVTPALWAWLRALVRYDGEGRCSLWLPPGATLPRIVAEAVCPGVVFSGVLLQGYRDGRAVTPCHRDPGGGFILSLGAARTFRVHRGNCAENLDPVSIACIEGTVLIMDEAFHRDWHHQVAADPGVTDEKLSLVFRTQPGG